MQVSVSYTDYEKQNDTSVCHVETSIDNNVYIHILMRLSQPQVIILDFSCGCHNEPMHVVSCAFQRATILCVFQSQMNILPSASPDIR